MIPVTARVVLSSVAKERYNNSNTNPHNLIGIVVSHLHTADYPYLVLWENKFYSMYRADYIESVPPPKLEDLI